MEEIDKAFIDFINFIKNSNEESFEENLSEHYTVNLSNKQSVELVPQGGKKKVDFESRMAYIDLLMKARINENYEQMLAIRKGLLKIIPLPLLNTISGYDLEIWVAGKSKVDFDLLRRHTRYGQGLTEDSPIIKHFWEVLHEFNVQESIRFVKFCWGQERLPANDEEFERTQTRFMLKHATHYKENQKDFVNIYIYVLLMLIIHTSGINLYRPDLRVTLAFSTCNCIFTVPRQY